MLLRENSKSTKLPANTIPPIINLINKEGAMEHRNFIRVKFSAAAAIRCKNEIILGDVVNVSLQGLFIKTDKKIAENLSVDVTVYPYPKTSFNLHADIVRRE